MHRAHISSAELITYGRASGERRQVGGRSLSHHSLVNPVARRRRATDWPRCWPFTFVRFVRVSSRVAAQRRQK